MAEATERLTLVQQLYAAFANGDAEALLARLSPDVERRNRTIRSIQPPACAVGAPERSTNRTSSTW
jgi:ketosteroid isomerase-like protein